MASSRTLKRRRQRKQRAWRRANPHKGPFFEINVETLRFIAPAIVDDLFREPNPFLSYLRKV